MQQQKLCHCFRARELKIGGRWQGNEKVWRDWVYSVTWFASLANFFPFFSTLRGLNPSLTQTWPFDLNCIHVKCHCFLDHQLRELHNLGEEQNCWLIFGPQSFYGKVQQGILLYLQIVKLTLIPSIASSSWELFTFVAM